MVSYDAIGAFFNALLGDDERELYDRAPCGFVSTNLDGTIIKANHTFLAWLGLTQEDLERELRFPDLLNVGGKIFYETHCAPTLRMQGQIREIALDFVRSDGSRLPALVNSVLDSTSNGERVIRTVIFDATERRSYEHELLRAKERAEASEAAARSLVETLQQTLIPPTVPQISGLEVAAAYRPAGDGSEVGGDFYDVFRVSEDEWFIVVGDVRGKGVEAAVVTSAARYTIRAAAMDHRDMTRVLSVLNEVLMAHESERFCTVVLVRLRREGPMWSGEICNAGHPPAILRTAMGATSECGTLGTVAGVLEVPDFTCDEIDLAPGTTLVLYTDGVTEGRRGDEFYGEERLHETIAGYEGSAESQVRGLVDELVEFQNGDTCDDIVVVAIRVPE